jgi:hypothetical protein
MPSPRLRAPGLRSAGSDLTAEEELNVWVTGRPAETLAALQSETTGKLNELLIRAAVWEEELARDPETTPVGAANLHERAVAGIANVRAYRAARR